MAIFVFRSSFRQKSRPAESKQQTFSDTVSSEKWPAYRANFELVYIYFLSMSLDSSYLQQKKRKKMWIGQCSEKKNHSGSPSADFKSLNRYKSLKKRSAGSLSKYLFLQVHIRGLGFVIFAFRIKTKKIALLQCDLAKYYECIMTRHITDNN